MEKLNFKKVHLHFCCFFTVTIFFVTSFMLLSWSKEKLLPKLLSRAFLTDLDHRFIHTQIINSEATPSAAQFFNKSYKISHPPWWQVSQDSLSSFATLSWSGKIWLSKWIFYVKNHLNLFYFFSMNKNLVAHLLWKLFSIHFSTK